MVAPDNDHKPPYIHLHPPIDLPGGGVRLKVRAPNAKIYTLTIPRRQSTVTGMHEAIMAAIESDRRPPAAP